MVGFDIAGAEAGFPPTRHLDAFEYLQRENFHFTIHAGEAFGLPSIWQAIQWCGADRLGHGVRIVDDIAPDGSLGRLAAYVRDKRIPLELCPSSNVQTGAAASIAEHPIGLLRDLRFRVTVNTDNRLMSGTSMSREMALLVEAFGYGWTELQWFTINAMKSAFIPFDERLRDHQRGDQAGVREVDGLSSAMWVAGEQPGHPAQHLPGPGRLRAEAHLPTQHRGLGPKQRHPAPNQHPRRLALLGQVAGESAQEGGPARAAQRVRPGEQATAPALLDDLGGEDPFGHEKWRSGDIKWPGGHPSIGTDRINRHIGSALAGKLGNDFHRTGGVPGVRRFPIHLAVSSRQRRVIAVFVEVVQAQHRQAGLLRYVRLSGARWAGQ